MTEATEPTATAAGQTRRVVEDDDPGPADATRRETSISDSSGIRGRPPTDERVGAGIGSDIDAATASIVTHPKTAQMHARNLRRRVCRIQVRDVALYRG